MKKDLEERVITATQFIRYEIEDYLDEHEYSIGEAVKDKSSPRAVLALVLTLKSWANPNSSYSVKLDNKELKNFSNVIAVLNEPKSILKHDKELNSEDQAEIKALIQAQINYFADSLIEKYALTAAIEDEIKKNDPLAWWNAKTDSEKKQIQADFEKLPDEKKKNIRTEVHQHYTTTYVNTFPDPFCLFWMSHYHCCRYQPTYGFDLPIYMPLYLRPFNSGYNFSSGVVSCDLDGDAAKGFLIIGAILSGLLLMIGGLVGALYSLKKTMNSTYNIFTGNKVLRSLYRLAGIGLGAYGGAVAGGLVGAGLGSIIPGIGNAVGFILGVIFGTGLGAGFMALVTKYSAKGISHLTHSNDINPTNPEKYRLTPRQKKNLEHHGFDLQVVDYMIKKIHREKGKIGIAGSFFWTKERKEKNKLNALLDQLKHNPGAIKDPVEIGGRKFYLRSSSLKTGTSDIPFGSTTQFIPAFGKQQNNLVPEMETPAKETPKQDSYYAEQSATMNDTPSAPYAYCP